MNDPHVERLHYRLVHDDSVTYTDCDPVEHETDGFGLRLVPFSFVAPRASPHPAPQPLSDGLCAP